MLSAENVRPLKKFVIGTALVVALVILEPRTASADWDCFTAYNNDYYACWEAADNGVGPCLYNCQWTVANTKPNARMPAGTPN